MEGRLPDELGRRSYAVYIPAWIMGDPRLNLPAKVLYGKILNLSREAGYCYAGNEHLGRDLGLSAAKRDAEPRTVSRLVARLRDAGHVRQEGHGKNRKLYPVNATAQLPLGLKVPANPATDGVVTPPRMADNPATNGDRVVVVDKELGYSDDFEAFWRLYPKRDGGNPKKPAWKRWRALTNGQGVDPADLIEAARSYAESIRRRGKEGTEGVLQAQTFLGPNDRWKDDYSAPSSPYADAWDAIVDAAKRGAPTAGEIPLEASRALYDLGGVKGVGMLRPRDLVKTRARFFGLCADEAAKMGQD